jgi:hypothetical protein
MLRRDKRHSRKVFRRGSGQGAPPAEALPDLFPVVPFGVVKPEDLKAKFGVYDGKCVPASVPNVCPKQGTTGPDKVRHPERPITEEYRVCKGLFGSVWRPLRDSNVRPQD